MNSPIRTSRTGGLQFNGYKPNTIVLYVLSVLNTILKGRDNLKRPLVIMGIISMIGGLTSLRLPETLHERLPQTLQEGENFGKDWSIKSCMSCYSKQKVVSKQESYENLHIISPQKNCDSKSHYPMEINRPEGASIKRLVRQMSIMDTQRNIDGTMQLTHWI